MAEKKSLRTRLRAWVIGGFGGGLAAIVAFVMAVLDAQPKAIPNLDPQRKFETGQWQVAPLIAYAATDAVHGYPLKDRHALVLEVQLANRTAETSSDYQSLFEPDIPLDFSDRRPTVVLLRDFTGQTTPGLQPGLDERMAFVWLLPKTGQAPTELVFTVNTKHYKPQDNLKGRPGWFNEEPYGKLKMTVAANDGRATQ